MLVRKQRKHTTPKRRRTPLKPSEKLALLVALIELIAAIIHLIR